jgi:pyocin large subunit-like protein
MSPKVCPHALQWSLRQNPPKSADKFVLLALVAHLPPGKRTCFPSIAAICDLALLKRQTVIDCPATLEALGLIEDTGDRSGRTRQIKVWRVRVEG